MGGRRLEGEGGGEKGEGNELVFNLKVQRKREEGEHERLETGNGGNGGGGGGRFKKRENFLSVLVSYKKKIRNKEKKDEK